jgi:hypothetical protein
MYSADSFTALEIPTLAKMNKLWSNDASFNNGTGIADNAILTRHLTNLNVTTAKMKPTYVKNTAGNGNASTRQTIGTGVATLTGTQFSYTSGPTAELLFIMGECIAQIGAAGAQAFIAVNNVAAGKTTYQDTISGYFKHTPFAFYEIPANTTVTVSVRFKGIGGSNTIANSNGDAALSESYGQSIELIAFGR